MKTPTKLRRISSTSKIPDLNKICSDSKIVPVINPTNKTPFHFSFWYMPANKNPKGISKIIFPKRLRIAIFQVGSPEIYPKIVLNGIKLALIKLNVMPNGYLKTISLISNNKYKTKIIYKNFFLINLLKKIVYNHILAYLYKKVRIPVSFNKKHH